MNVVAMTLAARHRLKSDKCLESAGGSENQLKNQVEMAISHGKQANQMPAVMCAIKKGRASFFLKDGGPKLVEYRPGPGDVRLRPGPIVPPP